MDILLFVMILIIKQGHIQAAAVFLSCPNHIFNSSVDNFITGWFDSSVLANASCAFQVKKNEFVLRKGSVETKICDQDFSTSTVICNTNYNAENCKCENNSGTNYSYTLKFVANSVSIAGDIILRSDCRDSNLDLIFESPPCSIDFEKPPTPTTTTTTVNTPTTKSTTSTCENCNCNDTCNCPDNCNPCPVWCIVVVSVCVPVGGGLIITITVIIIKYKKKENGENRSVTIIRQEEHNGTKLEPFATPTQEGHKGANLSPEKEKRRKKKKKKKPVQEVGGESVSREEKSTVNGHKAAQKSKNDNSVSVDENSLATVNGEQRRLPMLKTSHLTSGEIYSTNFQSETPRKLPPLTPKQ